MNYWGRGKDVNITNLYIYLYFSNKGHLYNKGRIITLDT